MSDLTKRAIVSSFAKMLKEKEFFSSPEDGIFYIRTHSCEFDIHDTRDKFEEFCKFISRRDGVKYLTNREAIL